MMIKVILKRDELSSSVEAVVVVGWQKYWAKNLRVTYYPFNKIKISQEVLNKKNSCELPIRSKALSVLLVIGRRGHRFSLKDHFTNSDLTAQLGKIPIFFYVQISYKLSWLDSRTLEIILNGDHKKP